MTYLILPITHIQQSQNTILTLPLLICYRNEFVNFSPAVLFALENFLLVSWNNSSL